MKNKFNSVSIGILITLVFTFSTQLVAAESDYPKNYYDMIAVFLILIIVIGFIAMIYFEGRKDVQQEVKESLFARFRQFVTRSTPIEKEAEVMLDHDYDGIKELDNRIPPWFSWLFYVTIIFSVWYMIHYHVLGTGKLQAEEYEAEVQLAELKRAELIRSGAFINEETVTLLTEAADLQSGKAIYDANCVACHGQYGEGLVGPNLTDDYWIHGGGIKNVFKVTKYGVPAKGMIAWQSQLSPNQMQEVSSYIISLYGTNPPNPKVPEGEKWVEADGE
ncbi:MAG TPA: cbb3-type cytochrome c oxidase N-terminal domain-containing protein [Ignavibacteriaceae bacterium]|nr:cbb3-type cytochrome c oxidase N-terminal domain-containing protein [Ignavibacteriaceae bacterium]